MTVGAKPTPDATRLHSRTHGFPPPRPATRWWWHGHTALVLLLAVASFAVQVRYLDETAAPYTDEGDHLYAALLLRDGQVPYRDFFYLHPPAFASLLSLGLRLTDGVYPLRCIYLAANVLGAVFLFLALRSLPSRNVSATGALLAAAFFLGYHEMVHHDFRFLATRQFANSFLLLPFFYLGARPDSRYLRWCRIALATVMALHLYQGFLNLVLLSFGLDTVRAEKFDLRATLRRQARLFAVPVAALAGFLWFFPDAYQCSVVEHLGAAPGSDDLLLRISVLLGSASLDHVFTRTGTFFLVLGAIFLKKLRGLCWAMIAIVAATFVPSEFFPHYFVLSAPALAFGVFVGFELLANRTGRPAVAAAVIGLLLALQWKAVHESLLAEWSRKDPEFHATIASLRERGEPFLTFMNPIYAVEAGKKIVPHYYVAQMRFFRVRGDRYAHDQYDDLAAQACTIVLSGADVSFLGRPVVEKWLARYPAARVGQVLALSGEPGNCRREESSRRDEHNTLVEFRLDDVSEGTMLTIVTRYSRRLTHLEAARRVSLLPRRARISSQNASRSSGLRDVIRLPSATTSRSTHVAPAFSRSFLTDGHDVTVLPRTMSASMSSCGP